MLEFQNMILWAVSTSTVKRLASTTWLPAASQDVSLHIHICNEMGFPGATSGKEPTCQFRRCKRNRFDLWVGKMPWWRKWKPTPVFLPGESHGQGSLVGYGPWGRTESDTTERLNTNTHKELSEDNHKKYEGNYTKAYINQIA